ncbi:MAG: hypothetical protein ABI389_02800, partial [Rhodanobacter sp.]
GFGQLFRSFSLNSYGYSPQTIEKPDSNPLCLAHLVSTAHAPSRFHTLCNCRACHRMFPHPNFSGATPPASMTRRQNDNGRRSARCSHHLRGKRYSE